MQNKRAGEIRRKAGERRLPFDRRIQNVIVSQDRRKDSERRATEDRRSGRDRRVVGI